jgi:hypothetical protein
MNEIFNPKRFGAYALRSWNLYAKRYLLLIAIYAGITLGSLVLARITYGGDFSFQAVSNLSEFWFGPLAVTWFIVFTMITMSPLRNRHTMVLEHSIPVSTTEKWLFVLLNGTVVAAVIYSAIMFVTALVGITLSGNVPFIEYFLTSKTDWWKIMIVTFLPLQAAVMFAGTTGRKNHATAFLLLCLTLLAALLLCALLPALVNEQHQIAFEYGPLFTFDQATAQTPGAEVIYRNPLFEIINMGTFHSIIRWGGIASALIFWICSWLNMKERSIK